MTVVAFTGTRNGMTDEQADAVRYVLEQIRLDTASLYDPAPDTPDEFHYGDCVGADEEAFEIAKAREFHTHCHPAFPEGDPRRAGTKGADETYDVFPPLARNKRMVDASDILVAAPSGAYERVRSGTWATIRYARMIDKPIVMVLPSGAIQ